MRTHNPVSNEIMGSLLNQKKTPRILRAKKGDLEVKIILKSQNLGEEELALMLAVAVQVFGGGCEKPVELTHQLISQQRNMKHNSGVH